MPIECDIAVIGGGPGGYSAAIRAAQLGANAVLIEKDQLGGTCTNRGCIPSKALLDAAARYQEIQEAATWGISVGTPTVDFAKVQERKNQVVRQLRNGVEGLVKGNRINLLRGAGAFVDPHRLSVQLGEGGSEEVVAKHVVIATGSVELRPPIPGLDLDGVFGSDAGLELTELPPSVIVVGGGPLGCEFASMFRGFGVEVTIVEMMPALVPNEDAEIGRMLGKAFAKRRITVKTGARVERIERDANGLAVTISTGDPPSQETLRAPKVMVAIGRTPYTQGLGLERIGVAMKGRSIGVDERMRTSVPDVYAIGDVAGGAFAHVAFTHADVAVENALGQDRTFDGRIIPSVTFSFPQVASVGLSEQKALETGQELRIGRFPFVANAKSVIDSATEGMVKVVAEAQYGQILGVSIIGAEATGLIGEMALALTLESTIEDIAQTIHPHPTLPESLRESALDADGRALHIMRRRR